MFDDKIKYKGSSLRIISREIEGESYELVRGAYEAVIAITDKTVSNLLLVKRFSAVSISEEWMLPGGALIKNGDHMRGVVERAAKELGFNINTNEMNVLAFYYPSINYDTCKHAIFTIRVSEEDKKNNKLVEEKARWFTLSDVDRMVSESEILDTKIVLAYHKLLQLRDRAI
jgi:hypothetical protein